MNYLFILGRDPELSLLELESYFESNNIEYKIFDYTKEIALISLPKLDFNQLIKEIGGTIKIGEVFSDSDNLGKIEFAFNNLKIDIEEKLDYAVSCYNSTLFDFVRSLIKERAKSERVKAFYKKPKRKEDKVLTPSELIHKKIIEKGIDIVIFKNNIARTIAVFNPFDIQQRDLNRPKNDFLKNISIRLAKILVNLSGVKKKGIILDPFCGTGTILQEALLNKINVIGVDLDDKSISDTNENINWLKKSYNITNESQIKKGDSKDLSRIINKKVDAIVTEPYMGPFLKKPPSRQEVNYIVNELTPIYESFFKEIPKILNKNGKIIIVMPEFNNFLLDPLQLTEIFRLYEPRLNIKLPIPYILKNSRIKRYIYVLELK